MRTAKKNSKFKKIEKKEKAKKEEVSYEIAGTYYQNIQKVKSKSRAILSMKKDGEKLTGNDEAFMKEILKYHDRGSEKLKDFDHFEVNQNTKYENTRCFFVVRKDESKEDFSVVKCINNLEKKVQ